MNADGGSDDDPRTGQDATRPTSFEDALGELADLVAQLESGSLGLSESIDGYERGVAILSRLHDELARAEERVAVLVKIDDQGRPVLAPLESGGQAAAQPPTKRARAAGRSKAAGSRTLPGMDDPSGGE